jgi:hypothetical protein
MADTNLNPYLIYLAGPVDGIAGKDAKGWREYLSSAAPPNIGLFSPAHAYLNITKECIVGADVSNRQIIANCSGVLANLLGPGRGFGTIREIEFANMHHKIVVVAATDLDDTMLTYDLQVRPTLDEAFDHLLELINKRRNAPPQVMTPLGMIQLGPDPEEDEEQEEKEE